MGLLWVLYDAAVVLARIFKGALVIVLLFALND